MVKNSIVVLFLLNFISCTQNRGYMLPSNKVILLTFDKKTQDFILVYSVEAIDDMQKYIKEHYLGW